MTFSLLLTFIFFVFWRPQDWLLPWLSGWNMLDVIIVFASVAFFMEMSQGVIKNYRKLPQVWLMVGLFVASLLSHVAHGYFQGMIDTIPPMFKLCYVTILLLLVVNRISRLRGVAAVFLGMACFMAVHALLQQKYGEGFAGGRPLYIPPRDGNEGFYRSLFFGIFSDPNDLAQMLATCIPFSFVIFRKIRFFNFLFSCSIVALLVMGILATGSRGGLVALIAVSAVMFILLLPAKWLPVLMFLMGLSALFLLPLSVRFLDASAADRFMFWGLANQLFKKNFIFGIGYNMFWMVAEDRAAHNAFVSCYTELGFVGYWFWFVFLQLGLAGAWRTRMVLRWPETSDQRWLRRFAGMCIAAMIGYLVSAYFLSRSFQFPVFFLGIILGVLPVVVRTVLPDNFEFTAYNFKKDVLTWGSVGAVVSIFYIYFSILILNRVRGG